MCLKMFLHLICIVLIFHSANHVDGFFTKKCKKGSENQCVATIDNVISLMEELRECAMKSGCQDLPPSVDRGDFPVTRGTCYRPMDCAEVIQENPSAESGIYTIWLRSRFSSGTGIQVYCDMDDDGGGWTVIQRRGDYGATKQYFWRNWEEYKRGFGDLEKDFWLGNEIIYALTNQHFNSLKFELEDWEGAEKFAIYDEFQIDDEFHKYTAHVSGYHGNAGDSFSSANNVAFSTKDRDNDRWGRNCAEVYKGAWWYTNCGFVHLNALYLKGPHKSLADGVNWYHFRGWHYSLKYTTMKIRPKLYNRPNLPDK